MNTIDIDTLVLKHGRHKNAEEGMCVMEAVSALIGEEFSDNPTSVSPVITSFLRNWNDSLPGNERQQLKKYIPLVLNTRGSEALESKRAWMSTDWLARVQAPAWLELAGLKDAAENLRNMSEITSNTAAAAIQPVLESIRQNAADIWDAAHGERMRAEWNAALAAAPAAAGAAWDAAMACGGYAASCGGYVASWAATRNAANAIRILAWATTWDAIRAVAWNAADACAEKLQPTVFALQIRAHELVMKMIEAEELR